MPARSELGINAELQQEDSQAPDLSFQTQSEARTLYETRMPSFIRNNLDVLAETSSSSPEYSFALSHIAAALFELEAKEAKIDPDLLKRAQAAIRPINSFSSI